MEKVRVEDVDSWMSPASAKRSLTKALGAEHVSVNHYELAPGESFAFGYHAHEAQEEVFYVLTGTATFETEDGDVEVAAGEAVRFAPGEYQQGTNRSETPVAALAIGAPQEGGDVDIRRACPDCGERTAASVEMADSGDALITRCLECGAETARFT